jgi:hypothetical protein
MSDQGSAGDLAAGGGAGATPAFWPDGDAGRMLDQPEFVIPVIGAGVSRGAGLPGVPQLAQWIAENIDPGADGYTKPGERRLFTVV